MRQTLIRFAAAITLMQVGLEAQGIQGLLPTGRRQLNDFFEFRGRWVLDDKATDALNRLPEGLPAGVDILAGMEVPRELVITTTETEFSVAKDGREPEIYKVDGSETQERDQRTGVGINRFYRLTLVADSVALTRRRPTGLPTEPGAELITDAYSAAGPVLTIERLRSHIVAPGSVVVIKNTDSSRLTLIYRRVDTK